MSVLIYVILFVIIVICIYWFYTNVLLKLRYIEKYIESKDEIIEDSDDCGNGGEASIDESNKSNQTVGSLFDSHISKDHLCNNILEDHTISKDSLDGSISMSSKCSTIGEW